MEINPPHHNTSPRDHSEIGLFVADHVNAMLAYWDKNQICRFANDAYKEWFGKGREDMVDKITLKELLGPLYQKNLPYINGVLNGIPQYFEREIQIPSGEVRQTTASYYPDVINGVVVGFFVHVADITEPKKAEEYIRKYHALEAKNKEMEQFAYVASHDLREPLLTMTSFAELLQAKYKGKLDEEADSCLYYIMQSATRMTDQIKALMEYSLIGRERSLESVDCNDIVRSAINDMAVAIHESNARIEVKALPVINAYKLELRMLFQNLIGNAIKFRKKDTPPVITISAEKANDKWRFKVEDNGIGIEKKYEELIFMIFKRLNDRNEDDGSGIGLAQCKKIAELHNGDIWVESIPDQGSIFNFTVAM